jgi:short subunit dehydrogenase-like uncharacterized protein
MQHRWMIYGASGYTGGLIARQAVERGHRPMLSGRNKDAVEALARKLDCPCRIFALKSPEQIAGELAGVEVVLNCAGPFSATARPMIDGCLQAKVHYLDITGEIDVIEGAASLDERARQAGIALVPAVGFDVVPTDCLAALLAEKLPGAVRLELAFADDNGVSPGTAKTVVENLPRGGRARVDGEIVRVPTAWKSQQIPFDDRTRWAMTIPWGDVASAWHSTQIPNIEVYLAAPRRAIRWMRRLGGLARFASWSPVQRLLKWSITRRIQGPSDEVLRTGRAHLWGRVTDAAGKQQSAVMQTPSGYQLTRLTALLAVERILDRPPAAGFSTPSRALGAKAILEVDDVVLAFVPP